MKRQTFVGLLVEKIQLPNNVHFTPDGSRVLATQVAAAIEKASGLK